MHKKTRTVRLVALVMALVLGVGALLSASPIPTRAATVQELQNKLDKLAKEEKELKNQLSAYKSDVAKQQEYANSLKEKINNSKEQIELLRQQIELLDEGMEEKSAEIAGKEQDILTAEQKIDDQLKLFGERLRVISQTGNMSALQMIFNTESYVDYLLKTSVVERIAQNDQRMIDELNEQIEELNDEKAELNKEKAALAEERKSVEALNATADEKKKELDALYAESNEVLKKLQQSVDSVNAELRQKAKEEAALDAEIKRLLAAANSTGKYTGGTMHWPVPTVRNISSGYGYRWGTIHRGVDIANGSIPIYGQNIVSAADGTVVYANKSGYGGGYGLFVMVDHGYDDRGRQIVTLYAHMSAVTVNVGDKVTGGHTILGRAGATGNVTGPHLHFEVRVNGSAVDPLANGYLKLS
ncbi:MAG: peptidoglycan DD-metalloendopeptidase family protein [Clostridia bacterium]|nr:peptidoglycan DD-metalloendopeptidase family protein [Clostridia bacterium]